MSRPEGPAEVQLSLAPLVTQHGEAEQIIKAWHFKLNRAAEMQCKLSLKHKYSTVPEARLSL